MMDLTAGMLSLSSRAVGSTHLWLCGAIHFLLFCLLLTACKEIGTMTKITSTAEVR